RGERVAMQSTLFDCYYPKRGWVEQDAVAVWNAQMQATRAVFAQAGVKPSECSACGVTNQRETTVVWDRTTGKPVSPAIVWQCRRTADFCRELSRSPAASRIESVTGLVID